jgi:hypothetical protein
LAAAFLIAWASSAISVCQVTPGEAFLRQLQQRVGDDQQILRPGLADQFLTFAVAGVAVDAGVERRCEATCFGKPVAAYRGRRDDQRRPAGGALEQHGECLQRLAQAHVVGQTAAHAGGRQTHRPLVAVFLIGPQPGLQQARQFGFGGLGAAQALDGLAKILAGVEPGAVENLVEPGGGDRRCLASLPCRFRERQPVR